MTTTPKTPAEWAAPIEMAHSPEEFVAAIAAAMAQAREEGAREERSRHQPIMVDELKQWPGAKPPFDGGSCHLTGPLPRLHDFAAALGMKRAWFQDHPSAPHYDLTPKRRAKAIALGAIEVPAREQARARVRARGAR